MYRVPPHGGLSITDPRDAARSLLVACLDVRKIKEFSSHGDLLRELTLPGDVIMPFHTIQLTNGQFIVCHGGRDDSVNRVCMVSADGRHIVHSHAGAVLGKNIWGGLAPLNFPSPPFSLPLSLPVPLAP